MFRESEEVKVIATGVVGTVIQVRTQELIRLSSVGTPPPELSTEPRNWKLSLLQPQTAVRLIQFQRIDFFRWGDRSSENS
jgi:hypothetical protein